MSPLTRLLGVVVISAASSVTLAPSAAAACEWNSDVGAQVCDGLTAQDGPEGQEGYLLYVGKYFPGESRAKLLDTGFTTCRAIAQSDRLTVEYALKARGVAMRQAEALVTGASWFLCPPVYH